MDVNIWVCLPIWLHFKHYIKNENCHYHFTGDPAALWQHRVLMIVVFVYKWINTFSYIVDCSLFCSKTHTKYVFNIFETLQTTIQIKQFWIIDVYCEHTVISSINRGRCCGWFEGERECWEQRLCDRVCQVKSLDLPRLRGQDRKGKSICFLGVNEKMATRT